MTGIVNKSEVVTGVVTNLCEDTAKSIWTKVKKWFKDLNEKENIDYGIAYEKYLNQTKIKYGKIKTLIFNRTPQDLYSLYECTGLRYNESIIDTNNINNVLAIGNKILITGTGGIGKSTMIKHFFLNTIINTEKIPVLIELRSFNSQEMVSIFDSVYNSLKDNGFKVEEEYFEYSLEKGGYILLFDGYDELNREKSKVLSEQIQSFADKYSSNSFIISSRPSSEFIGWHDYIELSTLPLTKEQAISMIEKISFDENIKNQFVEELKGNLFAKHQSFAENPLLLTIMLLTYESNAKIPENINDFYERAFLALFSMHDATKEAYSRETKTGLSYESFKTVFSYICFKSFFEDIFEFTDVKLLDFINEANDRFQDIYFVPVDFQEDLVQHVCMLIKDGLVFRFSHRSFQEYFAALYTCKLTDEMQSKLLTAKLNESIIKSLYYEMLINFQEDRFIINVLLPGIKVLLDEYEESNSFLKVIKNIFSELRIEKLGKSSRISGLIIKDGYLYNIYELSYTVTHYAKSKIDKSKRDEVISKLMNSYNSQLKKEEVYGIDVEELDKYLSYEEIDVLLYHSIERIKVMFDLYNKYNVNHITENSVDAILKII